MEHLTDEQLDATIDLLQNMAKIARDIKISQADYRHREATGESSQALAKSAALLERRKTLLFEALEELNAK